MLCTLSEAAKCYAQCHIVRPSLPAFYAAAYAGSTVPSCQQQLHSSNAGNKPKHLEDNRSSLFDYNIGNNSTIHVQLDASSPLEDVDMRSRQYHGTIYVQMCWGNRKAFAISMTSTVRQLKYMIQDTEGEPRGCTMTLVNSTY